MPEMSFRHNRVWSFKMVWKSLKWIVVLSFYSFSRTGVEFYFQALSKILCKRQTCREKMREKTKSGMNRNSEILSKIFSILLRRLSFLTKIYDVFSFLIRKHWKESKMNFRSSIKVSLIHILRETKERQKSKMDGKS